MKIVDPNPKTVSPNWIILAYSAKFMYNVINPLLWENPFSIYLEKEFKIVHYPTYMKVQKVYLP